MLKSGLQVDIDLYKKECKMYNKLLQESKCKYYRNEFSACNDKQLFRMVNKLCSVNSSPILPTHKSSKDLGNLFGKFFHEKVEKIMTKLNSIITPPITVSIIPSCKSSLTVFDPVTDDAVREVIMESATKSCRLDPIPTWMLKESLDVLLPVISKLINKSLSAGIVPSSFKMAHVTPLLKKPNLDPENLQNYRPIANLPFIFKVLERVVATQIKDYLNKNNLFSTKQSAYRRFHSTETALLRVSNDLLLSLDKGDEVVLILLDYSAAFDTINHDTLFSRLKNDYGIGGSVLKWCISYLEHRKQAVVIDNTISDPIALLYGTPQGSVKGPLDFILYTGPLSNIVNSHSGINHMIYADDTQLYLVMKSINSPL